MSKSRKGKVYLGMSGGVDSSVSAGLLKQQGFDVVGIFIRVWEMIDGASRSGALCDWRAERREARRAAAHLDIPLLTLDLRQEYKQRVVDYFLAEYQAGRTPNPDARCNEYIKFGAFYDWALSQGADFVATGHYAQAAPADSLFKHDQRGGFATNKSIGASQPLFLKTSADREKDQTYFLWPVKQEQLSKILFPVGGYIKPEVRQLAQKFGLPNATKKDSQGLCFVGPIDFKAFLKRELKEKSGDVLNEQGEVIGRHPGAIFFTLGERHGFEIFKQLPDAKPYYVVAKDIKANTLTVSNHPQSSASNLTQEIKLTGVNWLGAPASTKGLGGTSSPDPVKIPFSCQARVRYRQPLQACRLISLDLTKKNATVIFTKRQPQLATPGQSLVLYAKDICLGGGVIV